MGSYLKSKLSGPPRRKIRVNSETFDNDPLAWSRPQERHHCGEFSMAAVQSYQYIEDHSQVDVGEDALFVAVYDGHKCDAAPLYIRTHALETLLRHIQANNNNMTENILRQALEEIETGFMAFVKDIYQLQHQTRIGLDSTGCLICIIWRGTLYFANAGHSRAILGSQEGVGLFKRLCVKQMVRDHNCGNLEIQDELAASYPEEEHICNNIFEKWYLKSLSETSRCIGYEYEYMKKAPDRRSFEVPRCEQVTLPFTRYLSEPAVYSRILKDTDRFIIFGSYGFWRLMSAEYAARVVNTYQREKIAKRLVTIALENMADQRGKRYRDLVKIPKGNYVSRSRATRVDGFRPFYHDDITVIVVYLDKWPNSEGVRPEVKSYRSYDDTVQRSAFENFYHKTM